MRRQRIHNTRSINGVEAAIVWATAYTHVITPAAVSNLGDDDRIEAVAVIAANKAVGHYARNAAASFKVSD